MADVLVIGEGIAGASAALAAAEGGASVTIVTKQRPSETNTAWAQGGIAAALDFDDCFEDHLADTIRVGSGLTDPVIARAVVSQGRDAVQWLANLGVEFDRNASGRGLALGREGGHGRARIVHAHGDGTGSAIQRSLNSALSNHPRIDRRSAFVRDLLVTDGRCSGAIVIGDHGELIVHARATIIASGGAGQIFRETTNPSGASGDGIALCFRAGAAVTDLEFVQFHPTTLYIAGAARCLISEAVRGAGAILRDRDGMRFMVDEHPDAELAPRDVVSRAILRRMIATQDTHAYLDLTELDRDPHRAFPNISRRCRSFDIDIAKEMIPVRPGAHYMIGGAVTDREGRTSVDALFAVGEAAASGLHGANRLASNSLLEGCVLGRAAGRAAARVEATLDFRRLRAVELQVVDEPPQLELPDLLYSLKSTMWRGVGLLRSAAGLRETLARVTLWERYLERASLTTQPAFELRNMLAVSILLARAALWRDESRGVHFREDFPAPAEGFARRLHMVRESDGEVGLHVQGDRFGLSASS